MKLILLKDLKKYGKKNDIINVKDGYATNYLLPKKIAMLATPQAIKELNKQTDQKRQQEVLKKTASKLLKEKIEKISLEFTLKTNRNQVFGTISSKQIIEKLHIDYAIMIDKKQLINFQNINHLGFSDVMIKLYEDIVAVLKIEIKGNQ